MYYKKALLIVTITTILIAPSFVYADTKAGITPSSPFYFLDTTFEKIGLIFTFDSGKKVEKALKYAEERLSEAEESVDNNKPKAVEKAIDNYEESILLATEKTKAVKNNAEAEVLLNKISDSTTQHQEILVIVLNRVSENAKESILKAIEVSKKGYEQAQKQVEELKKQVSELKEKVTKLEEEIQNSKNDEIIKLQKELEVLKKKQSSQPVKPQIIEKIIEVPSSTTQEDKTETTIVTFPSGAVVELNEKGEIIRIIKEAPVSTVTKIQPSKSTSVETLSVIISNIFLTERVDGIFISWETNIPTESKVFLGVVNDVQAPYNSSSGLSTRHQVDIGLAPGIEYSYEIEAIAGVEVAKSSGTAKTDKLSATSMKVDTSRQGTNLIGGSCVQSIFKVYVYDQNGDTLPDVPIIFTNPETSEKIIENTTKRDGTYGAYFADFKYTPTFKVSEKGYSYRQILSFQADHLISDVSISLRENVYEKCTPEECSDKWRLVEMSTTTVIGIDDVEKLKRVAPNYNKDKAWLSLDWLQGTGVHYFFDPDTKTCIDSR